MTFQQKVLAVLFFPISIPVLIYKSFKGENV
jgi:hypothetical protein